ncbi:hypothetical protein [Streptomyces sp. NPDC001340]
MAFVLVIGVAMLGLAIRRRSPAAVTDTPAPSGAGEVEPTRTAVTA